MDENVCPEGSIITTFAATRLNKLGRLFPVLETADATQGFCDLMAGKVFTDFGKQSLEHRAQY